MSYCINPKCCHFNDAVSPPNCPNCGPEKLLHNHYKVIEPLGKGGFGKTFKVEDTWESAQKVLKVLHIDDKRAVSLFQ
jgi:serine/threonine protein kinase